MVFAVMFKSDCVCVHAFSICTLFGIFQWRWFGACLFVCLCERVDFHYSVTVNVKIPFRKFDIVNPPTA